MGQMLLLLLSKWAAMPKGMSLLFLGPPASSSFMAPRRLRRQPGRHSPAVEVGSDDCTRGRWRRLATRDGSRPEAARKTTLRGREKLGRPAPALGVRAGTPTPSPARRLRRSGPLAPWQRCKRCHALPCCVCTRMSVRCRDPDAAKWPDWPAARPGRPTKRVGGHGRRSSSVPPARTPGDATLTDSREARTSRPARAPSAPLVPGLATVAAPGNQGSRARARTRAHTPDAAAAASSEKKPRAWAAVVAMAMMMTRRDQAPSPPPRSTYTWRQPARGALHDGGCGATECQSNSGA